MWLWGGVYDGINGGGGGGEGFGDGGGAIGVVNASVNIAYTRLPRSGDVCCKPEHKLVTT